MRPGQDLVVAGYAGLAGACRIAEERPEELSRWFPVSYIEKLKKDGRAWCAAGGYGLAEARYASAETAPAAWSARGASEWEEAGEGGIYTALWNLSGAYMTGFTVDLRKIPVTQATVEICERYGLNPYRLLSYGCTVLAADNGGRLAERLETEGVAAAVIGRVREGIAREVTYGDVRGFMERPRADELSRLGIRAE